VLGLVLAWNLFSSDELGVEATQFLVPWEIIAVVLVATVVVALLMTWIPARQASRIAPAEALRYDDVEKKGHHYPGSQGRPAGGVSPLAGHGVGIDDATHEPHDAILRYCQQVDTGLRTILRNEHAPLVLAGVEYLLPIYQRATTYPYLLEAGITGNPEGLRPEELQERAWAIVQPHFQRAQEGAAAQYRHLVGTGRATSDIPAIVMAAYDGRIGTLFVPVGVQQWGMFDRESRAVQVHQAAEAGDEDLLDVAAMYTFLKRGTIYAVNPDELPDRSPAAAILRY
jgi:hypothetical protein